MPSFLRRLSLHKSRKAHSSTVTPSVTGSSPLQQTQTHTQPQEEPEPEPEPLPTPETQTVLLLHAAKQPYELTDNYAVPQLEGDHEVLVRTQAIGLNPIDWKAP